MLTLYKTLPKKTACRLRDTDLDGGVGCGQGRPLRPVRNNSSRHLASLSGSNSAVPILLKAQSPQLINGGLGLTFRNWSEPVLLKIILYHTWSEHRMLCSIWYHSWHMAYQFKSCKRHPNNNTNPNPDSKDYLSEWVSEWSCSVVSDSLQPRGL